MVTIREVAERAGVSMPVVSAFLHGSKTVGMSDRTRQRVAAAISDLGYRPNRAAQSLRTSRTNVIAVVIPKLENPALVDMMRGLYDGAAEAGFVVMVIDAARLRSDTQLLEHVLSQGAFDGVIARRSATLDPRVLADLSSRGLPTVFLDNESSSDLTWLALDDALGVRTGTEYLIGQGHRAIEFIGGRDLSPDAPFLQLRYQGYVDAMEVRGLEVREPIPSGQSPQDGYAAFRDGVAQRVTERLPDAPTALIVNNATTATGVLSAARDCQVSIPEELSIVGYHDIDWASVVRPRLTTIKMPMYDLGVRGVRALATMVEGGAVSPYVLGDVPPELIQRDSVGPPRKLPG